MSRYGGVWYWNLVLYSIWFYNIHPRVAKIFSYFTLRWFCRIIRSRHYYLEQIRYDRFFHGNQIFIVLLVVLLSINCNNSFFLLKNSYIDDTTNRQNRDGSSRRYVRTGERADRWVLENHYATVSTTPQAMQFFVKCSSQPAISFYSTHIFVKCARQPAISFLRYAHFR